MRGKPKAATSSSCGCKDRIHQFEALYRAVQTFPLFSPARDICERAIQKHQIYSAELERVGSYLRLSAPERPGVIQSRRFGSVGGTRGQIKGFSSPSRMRLFREMNRLDPSLPLPLFLTLTLPGRYGVRESDFVGDEASPAEMIRRFKNWKDRLRRAHPEAFGLWRAEWQKRGALHWHAPLWELGLRDGRDLREFRDWLSRSWFECVGSGDEKHLRAGTQIVPARKAQGVTSYLTKEVGKAHQGACREAAERYGSVGRSWGPVNAAGLAAHQGEVERLKLTSYELVAIAVEIARRTEAAGAGAGFHWRSDPGLAAWVDELLELAETRPVVVVDGERAAA